MQKRKLNSSLLLLALMIKQAVDDWKKNPVAPAAPLAYLGRQAGSARPNMQAQYTKH